MLPEIQQLLILQDKDQTLKRLNQDLKRLPQEQERVKQKLANDTEAVKLAKTKIQENEVAIKNLQLQIGTRKETIARLKVQQFETRKNDEYSALGNEVVRYGEEVTKLEDGELELMEKAEELKAVLAEAQQGLERTQQTVETELGQINQRITNVSAQIKEFQGLRDGLASKVDETLLETYERIWKHRGDAAVVAVEGGICRGCNMKVSPSVAMGVKHHKELVNCSNCGRMVYME